MQNQRIRIRLKAFDYKLIDASTAEIVECRRRCRKKCCRHSQWHALRCAATAVIRGHPCGRRIRSWLINHLFGACFVDNGLDAFS